MLSRSIEKPLITRGLLSLHLQHQTRLVNKSNLPYKNRSLHPGAGNVRASRVFFTPSQISMTNRRKTAPGPFITSQISMALCVTVSFSLGQISMINLGECLPDAANWRNISNILYVILRFTTMNFVYCILFAYANDNVNLGKIIETFCAQLMQKIVDQLNNFKQDTHKRNDLFIGILPVYFLLTILEMFSSFVVMVSSFIFCSMRAWD